MGKIDNTKQIHTDWFHEQFMSGDDSPVYGIRRIVENNMVFLGGRRWRVREHTSGIWKGEYSIVPLPVQLHSRLRFHRNRLRGFNREIRENIRIADTQEEDDYWREVLRASAWRNIRGILAELKVWRALGFNIDYQYTKDNQLEGTFDAKYHDYSSL